MEDRSAKIRRRAKEQQHERDRITSAQRAKFGGVFVGKYNHIGLYVTVAEVGSCRSAKLVGAAELANVGWRGRSGNDGHAVMEGRMDELVGAGERAIAPRARRGGCGGEGSRFAPPGICSAHTLAPPCKMCATTKCAQRGTRRPRG